MRELSILKDEQLARFLLPGEIFFTDKPHQVTTILGTCVAVCLFDVERRVAGINHYLLPYWNTKELPTPRFGDVSIQRLIDRFIQSGSQRRHIQAKVFGGMQGMKKVYEIGKRNVEVAEDLLKANKIQIGSKDVGGDFGRKIVFDTANGAVSMRLLR